MYKRIDHVAVNVSDLDKSVAFYEQQFGFEKYFQHGTPTGIEIAYLKLDDTVLELVGRGTPVDGFHFCLETDDFDAALAQVNEAGLEFVQEPHKSTPRVPREEHWRRMVFKGPDGEHIEIRG